MNTVSLLFKRFMKEVIQVIPAIIYFLIAFHYIYFTTGFMLHHGEHRYFTPFSVTIFALIVGKVILLVNVFPFVNAFPKKPLIYNIVWKFFLYSLCCLVFWLIETTIHLFTKFNSFHVIPSYIQRDIQSPLFLSAELWLSMTFLIFVIASEFIRVLTKEKVIYLLFGISRKSGDDKNHAKYLVK